MTHPRRVARIEAALARFSPRADDGVEQSRKAAVAAVLRDTAGGVELLFIRRAQHPRDPWSGHMGFPGGRVETTDASPFDAAVRETLEEVGLDLRGARSLGRLSEARTHLPLRRPPYSVVPFCFAIEGDPQLTPNHEVAETVWVPLAFLADHANREAFTWVRRGVPLPMPCYRFGGRVIWGLTLRIVDELLETAAAD